jgi:hypothetical protein
MPIVASSKSGVLILTDGTRTHEVYPQEGDVSITPGDTVFIEVKHRGVPMADGEGVISQESGYCEVTFTVFAHDFTDAVKTDAILRWMRLTSDTSAAAVPTASWASTTTRTDSKATLDVLWYPQGTGTGKRYAKIDDCLLITRTISEGSPSTLSVTLRSTTASYETWATA